MMDPAGEANGGTLRLDFDRRLRLEFCSAVITNLNFLPDMGRMTG
jgi:hypothetical protein